MSVLNAGSNRVLRVVLATLCVLVLPLILWTHPKTGPSQSAHLSYLFPEAPVEAIAERDSYFNFRRDCPSSDEQRFELYTSRWDEALLESCQGEDAPVEEPVGGKAITDSLYVYTAFLTNTTTWGVHIIGLVYLNSSPQLVPPLECTVQTGQRVWKTHVNVTIVNEYDPHLMTQPIYLSCPLAVSAEEIRGPLNVALKVSANDRYKAHWVPVHVPPLPRVDAKCCSVCVSPIFGNRPTLWELIEFVAHYQLIGAGHFYFYYTDVYERLLRLVSTLQSNGVDITLIHLRKPNFLRKNFSSEQIAHMLHLPALHDCIFRSRMKTEYFVHVDFDELMVPRRGGNLTGVIDQVEKQMGTEALGSLIVRSRLFCYEYGIDYAYMRLRESLPLRSRVLFHRAKRVQNAYIDKMIARGSAVCAAYKHWVSQYCGPFLTVGVSEDIVYFSHYCRCCTYFNAFDHLISHPEKLILDRRMKTFDKHFYSTIPFKTDMRTAPEGFQ